MARGKSREKKKHLSSELKKNAKTPVWIYMKTKSRELLRGRKRSWRRDKLGKKIKKKMKQSKTYRKKKKK